MRKSVKGEAAAELDNFSFLAGGVGLLGGGTWLEFVITGDLGGEWFGECVAKKTPIRFSGQQIEYGSRDVFFRVGGWRGGVGVAETAVGVGGGDVRRVYDFTSRSLFAGQISDVWQWQPDPRQGYSIRGAYQLSTSQQLRMSMDIHGRI
ncbi:hypothetical protein L195_g023189 [Trifolium pratense]|uniref:Uncharacterized protein n=1 Tax=Trifolium pratense TaxID=57577 RepID=A0A2K3NA41_TRIPR|nr:hypothetical protein L195_g023189 [Trifolium pratense]